MGDPKSESALGYNGQSHVVMVAVGISVKEGPATRQR